MYVRDSEGKAARTSKELSPDSLGSVFAYCNALASMSKMLSTICCPGMHRCCVERCVGASCVSGKARQSDMSLLSVLLSDMGRVFSGLRMYCSVESFGWLPLGGKSSSEWLKSSGSGLCCSSERYDWYGDSLNGCGAFLYPEYLMPSLPGAVSVVWLSLSL